MTSPFPLRLLTLSLMAAFAAPAATAQAAAAADGAAAEKLETIVVTARKREETLKDVPVAVTALSGDSLDRLNVKNLGDLQGNVPNLTIYAARGSNTTLTTFIRGVGQADPLWGVDPGVGIYLDDAYIARPQGALLEVFDVQRVEVLRGPQGTLYGKNTIGGAVKYVSKPLGTATTGSASLTLGSYGQAQIKGSLGGSTADGQVRARFAAASLNREGYGINLTDGSDVSNQRTDAARVSLGWFPSGSSFSLQATADETRDTSNMRGFQRMGVNPSAPTVPPSTHRYNIASGMPNQNSTDSGGHSFTAQYALSDDWRVKYIHSYRSSETDTSIDFDGLPNKIADVRAFYADASRSHELQLAGTDGVIGLYRFEGRAGGRVRNNFFNLLFGDTNGQVLTTGTALFGEWDWKLMPRLGLTTGLRYTQEEKRAIVLNRSFSNDTFTVPTATSANFDQTRKVSNTSPKLSLAYELSNTTNLYATLSRGFKSGGYNIRANTAAVPASGRPFDDEVLDSLELGAKMQLGTLELNTAAFFNQYKNVQLSIFTAYTTPQGQPAFFGDFTNAGKADVNGLEAEFIWRPSSSWQVRGNAAYTNAKYKEYIDRGVNVASQKKFTNTPKFSGALDVEHRTSLGPWGELRSRVGVSHRSKVYPTTDLSEVIAQPGFTLLNAGLIWQVNPQLSYSLQGSNLTDKAYRTDGYNIPALGVLSGFYGAPRTVSVTAAYRF